MNIVQLTEHLKDLPKEQLVGEAQRPSGMAPPYLIIGELQRRKRMESALNAAQNAQQPQTTVAQDVVNAAGVPPQGLAQMAGALAPKTDMAQNTGRQPTAMMAEGTNKYTVGEKLSKDWTDFLSWLYPENGPEVPAYIPPGLMQRQTDLGPTDPDRRSDMTAKERRSSPLEATKRMRRSTAPLQSVSPDIVPSAPSGIGGLAASAMEAPASPAISVAPAVDPSLFDDVARMTQAGMGPVATQPQYEPAGDERVELPVQGPEAPAPVSNAEGWMEEKFGPGWLTNMAEGEDIPGPVQGPEKPLVPQWVWDDVRTTAGAIAGIIPGIDGPKTQESPGATEAPEDDGINLDDPKTFMPPTPEAAAATQKIASGGTGSSISGSLAQMGQMAAGADDKIMEEFTKDKWLALARAGAAIMMTPNVGMSAIGAGVMAGLEGLAAARSNRDAALEAQQAQAMEQAKLALAQRAAAARGRGGGGAGGDKFDVGDAANIMGKLASEYETVSTTIDTMRLNGEPVPKDLLQMKIDLHNGLTAIRTQLAARGYGAPSGASGTGGGVNMPSAG